MKNIFVLILIFTIFNCNAQNEIEIHLDSDPGVIYNGQTIVYDLNSSSYNVYMHLLNNTNEDMEVLFRRVILESDVTFYDQFCDDDLCFPCSGVDWTAPSSTLILAGDSTLMKPQGTFTAEGTALIRYYIINNFNSEILDSVDLSLIYNLCSTTSISTHVACDSYTWIDGNTYYSSNNTATTILTNNAGCDSIIELDLTILDAIYSTDFQTACDSYTWVNGITYNESTNSPIYTFENTDGCDSIVTLNLTLLNNSNEVDFSSNVNSFTTSPFLVEFSNTTPNISDFNFYWDFGDGTTLESNNNLVFHEYLTNGLYDVTLIAENTSTGCVDTMYKPDFIYCTGGNSPSPSCEFFASSTQITPGTAINFFDLTQNNPNSWMWIFEGGTPSYSINQSPSGIVYENEGVFDVTLIAVNSNGADTLTKFNFINVDNSTRFTNSQILNFNIYPNPTKYFVNIKLENYIGEIYTEVYNLLGDLILKTNKNRIDLHKYEGGIYVLKIAYEDKKSLVKLIKE